MLVEACEPSDWRRGARSSNAEAQARLVAAFAAQRFAMEQARLVQSDINGAADMLISQTAEHPADMLNGWRVTRASGGR